MHLFLSALLLAQAPEVAELHLYRYWRPPDITAVVGFVAVPLQGLTFLPDAAGARQTATYRVDVSFRDSAGNVLHRDHWTQRITTPPGEVAHTARGVDPLSFDLRPGSYEVMVEVTDSVSGRSEEVRRTVDALAARPLAGDLILASSLERLVQGGAAPAGSLVRSGTAILPNLGAQVAGLAPSVSLYTEFYPPDAETDSTAHVTVLLRSRTGEFRHESRAALKRYPAEGGVEMLHVPLTGLAPGDYTIGVRVVFAGGREAVVERAFTLLEARR